mgnify:CR=1 FL=1
MTSFHCSIVHPFHSLHNAILAFFFLVLSIGLRAATHFFRPILLRVRVMVLGDTPLANSAMSASVVLRASADDLNVLDIHLSVRPLIFLGLPMLRILQSGFSSQYAFITRPTTDLDKLVNSATLRIEFFAV